MSIEQVNVYVDEIKEYRNQIDEKWAYIGVLIVPTRHHRRAQKALQTDRDESGYSREVHFTKLKNYSYAFRHNKKTLLAKKWLRRVLDDGEKIFHFSLLGINLTNLQYNVFGRTPRERKDAIYNRFLRPAILYPARYFFSGQAVEIKMLYHDETELQHHDWFKQHVVTAINEANVPVGFGNSYRIQFINSDHHQESRFPRESHFVQLCDILTGAITHVLDNRSRKDGCNELAADICPLVERLVDPRSKQRKNSPFNHYQRLHISFFPSCKLTTTQLNDPAYRNNSTFYVDRQLLWLDKG
jgi:hypothetical protein